MQLNLKTFQQVVQDMGAALQSSATTLVDISVGSVLRALFEANAAIVLWLQWLILRVLSMTRASTSIGADLDSWMADFGLRRLPATPASGMVTFSRYTMNLSASIPVGTMLKTADGLVSFSVIEDTTLSTWQPASSAYVMPMGVASCDVPAVCMAAGSIGNVLAGTINVIASAIPGIDLVNNVNPFVDGTDLESDQAFRARFQDYLAGLSRATLAAVESAITNVQQGLIFLVKENVLPDGEQRVGSFLIIVDDGTGIPPAALISSIASAVDLVRPIGTSFTVIPPTVNLVEISLMVSVPAGGTAALGLSVQKQITTYLNNINIERPASITRVAQAAYAASSLINNVSALTINGMANDFTPPLGSIIKAGNISVTFNAG